MGKEYYIEIKVSAEIFPVALGKALGHIFVAVLESVLASSQSLGELNILQSINFENREQGNGDKHTVRSETINISLTDKKEDGFLGDLFF